MKSHFLALGIPAVALLEYVQPSLPNAMVWLIITGVVALVGRPEQTLVVTALLALIGTKPFFSIPLASAASIVLAFGWLLRSLRTNGMSRRLSLRLLLTLVATTGVFLSVWTGWPADDAGQFIAGQWLTLMLLLASCTIAASLCRWRDVQVRTILSAVLLILGATIVAAASGLRAASDYATDRQLESLLGGSNYIAAIAAFAGMTLLCISSTAVSKKTASFAWFGVLLAAALAIQIASRGATLSLAAGLIAYMLLGMRDRSGWQRTSGMLALAVLMLVFTSSAGQLLRERVIQEADDNGRAELWQGAADAFLSSPIVGVGAGGMPQLYAAAGQSTALYPHNLILSSLAQFGILFGPLVLASFMPTLRTLRRSPLTPALATALIIGLVEPSIEALSFGSLFIAVLLAAESGIGIVPETARRSDGADQLSLRLSSS